MTIENKRPEEEIQNILYQHGASSLEEASLSEIYRAVSYYMRETIGKQMWETEKKSKNSKVVVYMSMEYLPGSLLRKNIDYLNIQNEIEEALEKKGISFNELILEDREIKLGHSDIGYLSNGLMDTLSSGSYNAIGYGLLYREGLFRQEIKNYEQVEKKDKWWLRGKNWLYKGDLKYKVKTAGKVDISMTDKGLVFMPTGTEEMTLRYYDLPYLGYQNGFCNRLRLFDHESLTRRIGPIESTSESRRERFKQEYILVSGALQDVIRIHIENNREIESLNEYFFFLMMDTELLLAVPELMRILIDDYNLPWEDAWQLTGKAFFYTPLVSLKDTLQTLEGKTIREWLPRLWMILEEIHHRCEAQIKNQQKLGHGGLETSEILWDDQVRLCNIPRAGVHKGPPIVHPLAVSHRRWIISANPPLRELMKNTIGDGFIKDPSEIINMLEYKKDYDFLASLERVKEENKTRLKSEIYRTYGIVINPYTVFHGYLKDFSATNRQLLMIMWILDVYLTLKENPNIDMVPKTIFIGGKAASRDVEGKLLIRLANKLAEKINEDFTIKEKIKLIFIDDLSPKKEEFIYPALDISHSLTKPTKGGIHLAGLSAMINGAVSISSREETNLFLREKTGEENMEVFGVSVKEAQNHYDTKDYNSQEQYYLNKNIRRTVDALLGREGIIEWGEFKEIHDMLIKHNDNNFILRDFEEYKKTIKAMEGDYLNSEKWAVKMLHNIVLSEEFASDVAVAKYAEIMWEAFK